MGYPHLIIGMIARSAAGAPRPEGVWQRRVLMGITAALAAAYVFGTLWTTGVRGSFIKGDARSYFAFLPSVVLDHDIDLRNQFAVLQPEGNTEYQFGVGRGGRAETPFPISPALLWLPGYVAGLAIDGMIGARASPSRPLGYGVGAMLGTAVWSILLAGAAAEITRWLVRDCVGRKDALLAAALAWLATPALYYSGITPLYSHVPAWFAVSLMLWLTWQAGHDPQRLALWLWSGFAAGWVVAVRLQDAALLAVPVVVLAATHIHSPRRALRVSAAWIGAALIGYLPQAVTWYLIEGTWVPFGGADALKAPQVSELAGILFSTGYRGWISWTPIVLPALAGLVLLARRGRAPAVRWFALSGLIGIAGMLTLDVTHPFGAGAAFGARRYVSATPLLAIGLGALLGPAVGSRTRTIASVLFPTLMLWNVWILMSYELLVLRHGIHPSLLQTVRYGIGLGAS
jgi:hypothetical protein